MKKTHSISMNNLSIKVITILMFFIIVSGTTDTASSQKSEESKVKEQWLSLGYEKLDSAGMIYGREEARLRLPVSNVNSFFDSLGAQGFLMKPVLDEEVMFSLNELRFFLNNNFETDSVAFSFSSEPSRGRDSTSFWEIFSPIVRDITFSKSLPILIFSSDGSYRYSEIQVLSSIGFGGHQRDIFLINGHERFDDNSVPIVYTFNELTENDIAIAFLSRSAYLQMSRSTIEVKKVEIPGRECIGCYQPCYESDKAYFFHLNNSQSAEAVLFLMEDCPEGTCYFCFTALTMAIHLHDSWYRTALRQYDHDGFVGF
ncbi:hypothetical protein CHISP_0571 [Chitinispirillum alkaliphilum]|nr:hypothetical protein CHISP_0571 [Chitinispirillum alkaliphilum]